MKKKEPVIFQWMQWDHFGFSMCLFLDFMRAVSVLLAMKKSDADKFILWIEKNLK